MKKSELRQLIREEIQKLSEANIHPELELAIDVLNDNGIDDYPGGDVDAKGNPYITFDSNEDAKKANRVLKKNNFKTKIKGNVIDLI